jgi:hypothetical protein
MISNRRKADKIVDAKMAEAEEIKALKKPKAWGIMSETEKKDEGKSLWTRVVFKSVLVRFLI